VPKTVIALVVIGLVWIGYMAWPLYELTALVRAIDARDVSTVARYVNFDWVRASLTEQIASGYIRRSGVQPGPLAQQAIVVGLSVADPVIRKLVSPEALSELLAVIGYMAWPLYELTALVRAIRWRIRSSESWFRPKHCRNCWPWAGQLRSCRTLRQALSD
jgi:hypothetical protein